MLLHALHSIITYLHQHPHMGGIFAFLIAFAESLAIIGSIVPGSVTMTAVGALIGASILPATSTFLWAICGAFCGDFLSYAFGRHFHAKIRSMWPFRKYPKLLNSGEAFFKKHGGKSIVIGRFFGPIRPAVPLIAGILKFSLPRFTLAAIPSAIGWAILYMLPGVIVGALSIELPAGMAAKFVLSVLIVIAILWIAFWLTRLFLNQILALLDQITSQLWRFLSAHKTLGWITKLISDPKYPEDHNQMALLLLMILCAVMFIWCFISVATHGLLTHLDQPAYHLLRSVRNQPTDTLMLAFTLLGYFKTQLIAAFILFLWLAFQRHWRAAIHWIVLVVGSSGLIWLIKKAYYSPRPSGLLHGPTDSGFPSGHTTLSLAMLGFLAVLINRELPKERRVVTYYIVGFIVFMIALSRIYLGGHYLSQVIASFVLGFGCVLFITISYRRSPYKKISSTSLILSAIIIYGLVWAIYGGMKFQQMRYDYTLSWPKIAISQADWWQQNSDEIPLYRNNRLGKADTAFNIQYLGALKTLETILIAHGWKAIPAKLNFADTKARLAMEKDQHQLPLLPILYENHSPDLFMIKARQHGKKPYVLRLWRSSILIIGAKQYLWLGSMNIDLPPHKILTLHLKHRQNLFLGRVKTLEQVLPQNTWQLVHIPSHAQPKALVKLHWDGNLLLINLNALS